MSAGLISIDLDPKSQQLVDNLRSRNIFAFKKGISVVGKQYRKHINRIFKGTQRRDQELSWPPLNPLTIAFKKRKFGSNKGTLIGSGKLMRSLTNEGAEGNITKVSEFEGQFGTNIFYAKFHFTGLPNRRIKSERQRVFLLRNIGLAKKVGDKIPLPKRDPVTPNTLEIDKYGNILEREIIKNLNAINIEVD